MENPQSWLRKQCTNAGLPIESDWRLAQKGDLFHNDFPAGSLCDNTK